MYIKHDISELSRATKVAHISDQRICSALITPIVRTYLGPIESGELQVMETTDGLFPGDELAVNLPNHLLYGKEGYVRFPYLCSFYKTKNGAIVIKRDGTCFWLYCWYGDVKSGKGQLMMKTGLRDRVYDGTKWANDSALNSYPVDDPKANPKIAPKAKSVELSVYCFLPGTDVLISTKDKEFASFVANPFAFVSLPVVFMTYLDRVLSNFSDRAPGQYASPVPDFTKFVLPGLESLARQQGYDYLEACPSHYHVARWFEKTNFSYLIESQKTALTAFREGIKKLKSQGIVLTKAAESWLCVAQSLPSEFIPDSWRLNNPNCIWPQDCIKQCYIWMYKSLRA